jgi:hypothetical protein
VRARLAVLLAAAFLPGCAEEAAPRNLADACQLRKCICVDGAIALKRNIRPVQWHVDGRAYCAAGQRLELVQPERNYN